MSKMDVTAKGQPGYAWSRGCTCREVLIDYVKGTISHPYFECPHYGEPTYIEDTAPL